MSDTYVPPPSETIGRVHMIASVMDDMKMANLLILDLREVTDFTDFFVIGTANSAAQLRAAGRRVLEKLKDHGVRPWSPMENEGARWTVLDYGDVVVHILDVEARAYYQIEELWSDAPPYTWKNSTDDAQQQGQAPSQALGG